MSIPEVSSGETFYRRVNLAEPAADLAPILGCAGVVPTGRAGDRQPLVDDGTDGPQDVAKPGGLEGDVRTGANDEMAGSGHLDPLKNDGSIAIASVPFLLNGPI